LRVRSLPKSVAGDDRVANAGLAGVATDGSDTPHPPKIAAATPMLTSLAMPGII
jgi:hypothetical protein